MRETSYKEKKRNLRSPVVLEVITKNQPTTCKAKCTIRLTNEIKPYLTLKQLI